jgi:hypothetical protein
MILDVLLDASFLSRPNATSVFDSFHHLCRVKDPTFVSAPISTHSNRIPVICSSAQEAEYAGTFASAKLAVVERQVLNELAYPQLATIIHCDNEVAVGLANKTVKPKLSKACDMRWHWLQNRVGQGHFQVRAAHSLQHQRVRLFHQVAAAESPRASVSIHRRRQRPNDLSGTQRSLFPCICFLLSPSCVMFFI